MLKILSFQVVEFVDCETYYAIHRERIFTTKSLSDHVNVDEQQSIAIYYKCTYIFFADPVIFRLAILLMGN